MGRIPLTDAELFKALLLSRSRGGADKTERTYEIAAQWDGIERDLQHPDVWAFVADASASDTPTRITLLLDTLAGGPRGRARPSFHTFDVLREKVELSKPETIWNDVVQFCIMFGGLAAALMRRALADGRARGNEVSTLQATKLGRPVYERLGYRSFGTIEMWERRS